MHVLTIDSMNAVISGLMTPSGATINLQERKTVPAIVGLKMSLSVAKKEALLNLLDYKKMP
jgi:hypothetical protein